MQCQRVLSLYTYKLVNNSLNKTKLQPRRLFNTTKCTFSTKRNLDQFKILGIETSCDDTGCAIVDSDGRILGEALHSQHLVHLRNGGIIPPLAGDLHMHHIEPVVHQTFHNAGLTVTDIDAIAVTLRPGLSLSLLAGMKYAKYLCRKYGKPIIPIHHMEAHALMARMEHKVDFPFLVLLISGGHCLLSIVKDVDDFLLLGESIDDAPGEAFDKTARRMKLRNLEQFSTLSGGQAIELAASLSKNPTAFELPLPLMHYRDCNFSMSGLKHSVLKCLFMKEKEHRIGADGVIPEVYDLCAAFQLAISRHLCHRTQRAMAYAADRQLIPEDKQTLVVSGGVACNNFIAKALQKICEGTGYSLVRPRPKLCTDNGVMIAWNGVERWRRGIGVYDDFSQLDIEAKSPLGTSIIKDVIYSDIKCKWIKLNNMYD